MKKVLALILFAVLAFVGIHAQGTIQRIALLNLQKANVVESSRAGQIGLTDSNGNQRYAQYTEIDLVPITYTPTTTGNTLNYSEFVTTTSGDIWYIDWQGRGIRLYTAASAAAGDYDWLEIGNNQIPNSIRDSIYTDNYAAINVRLVWPQAQLLVGDSSTAANIVALGNRESRIGFYRLTGPNWSSVGQEGGSLIARLGTNTVGFEVQASGGISPSQPAAPFRSIVRINKDSTIQLVDFKSTRNDTTTIRNVLYTDAQGFLQSSMISELPQIATPSLYNASGLLKDTLEALGSNNRAFVARNSQYKLMNGSNFTGFALGKNTGIRIRSGISDTENEIFNQIFDGTYSITQKFNRDFNEFQLLKGNVNNTVRYSETENRYSIYDFSNDFYSEILQELGNTTITSSGGNISKLIQASDTLIGKSSSVKYGNKLGQTQFSIDCSKGFASYSRNVQDSILANDRRILDLGSLKRYLVLNPPSGGGSSRSWNRNGNTGTGTDTLGTTGNFPLNFYTNATKRMELTNDGKIALGLNSFGGSQASIYTNFSPTTRTFTGFGTGHWVNSSALPAIVLDNNTAATGKMVFTIQAQTAGRTIFEYRNDNGTGSPTGAANMLVLSPSTASSSKPSIGLNVAAPSSTLDVDGTIAFRANNITQAAAGTINALLSVDVASTLGVTYNGVVDGLVTFPNPTILTAKYMTVINTGTTDFIMYNTHLRAVNGKRAGTFMFNAAALSWEPTTVRPWTSTNALGTNTAVAANTVVDNIVSVSLPVAGTYELRGIIQGTIPAWADGDVEVRLGSGASAEANTIGMMKVFSAGTNTRMGLSFVKRVTVASATNVILSVNNRQETQALTILANASATGQGTSIYAEKID